MNTLNCQNKVTATLNILGPKGTSFGVCDDHLEEGEYAIYRVVGDSLVIGDPSDISGGWDHNERGTCEIDYILSYEYPLPDLESYRYIMVLSDGETYSELSGCKIVEVPAGASEDEVAALLRQSRDHSWGVFGEVPPPTTRPYA